MAELAPVEEVKAGSVTVWIRHAPRTVPTNAKQTNGAGAMAVAEAASKIYDSFIGEYYQGRERRQTRCSRIERSRKLASEVAQRLASDGAAAVRDRSGFIFTILASSRLRMEKILSTALGQDVSKLAAQEKQLLLSRLLARLAHEVRNPLSSLDIHVQLLEEDLAQAPSQMKEKAAGRFEIIHGELHRLENIVKHFLSLAGPSSLDLHQVEVAKVIHHVCELLRPEAAARGVELVMKVSESLPPLTADPAQLTQVLVNLVINAIQAVAGKGRVEVSAHTDAETESLAIEIHDTGPGIPVEKQSAIFEPFFTTKTEGSGLGLWIVQQIVTAHGGVAAVSNAPNGGAVFSVHLPLRKKENVNG